MDVGQAYARLEISDRTVDDAAVLATYEVNVSESPSQADDLNRALTAIAKSRDSRTLKERLGLETGEVKRKLSEWPVGIDNIGNTCYLNSLLQFYFTIKPLRDIVLNIDRFKMPSDDPNLLSRRVGARVVSKKEVDRAQRFVDELRKLFEQLIASAQTSFRPSPDVARLTLLSSSKAEIARRQSIMSADRPSLGSRLGQINGLAIEGPLGPPESNASVQNSTQISDEPMDQNMSTRPEKAHDTDILVNGDDRSEASSHTLVDAAPESVDNMLVDSQEVEDQKQILENKENLQPSKEAAHHDKQKDKDLQALRESSPARLNEGTSQTLSESIAVDTIGMNSTDKKADEAVDEEQSTKAPPSRPPPYPPRPQVQRGASDALKEAEYGAQQDVTEVIANVLFQLECAIKPESFDESGEQLDQIKSLFFAKQKSYTTNKNGTVRTSEEYVTDIKVDVASGPRDIYAALDGAFDVQDVEVGGGIEPQYATLSQLPPILSILIQRAQFDPTKKTTFKSDNHLELKETIYMDRYFDSTNPTLIERREESWAWKRRLTELQRRAQHLHQTDMGVPVSEVLENTSSYLQAIHEMDDQDLQVSTSLLDGINRAAQEATSEQQDLESQIKDLQSAISSQFIDMCNIPYRLAAVFIHVGSHNAGHYWIYIYDFGAKLWRKYNDEKVVEVTDTREIFEAPKPPRPPTPYYLVYVKENIQKELVDPVCRNVTDPPEAEDRDTSMEEYTEIPISITSEMIEDTCKPIMTQNDQMMQDSLYDVHSGLGW